MGVVARETCRASGRGTHHGTCPSTASSTISRVIVAVVAREVARVACLGLARGHQARPRGTCRVSWLGSRASTMQGLVPPWLGSRGTKQGLVAPWLGSWAGTMQGPVPPCLSSRAGIMQGPVVHLACLGSACGHHARPRGTRHGMGGGTCHVSLVKRPSFYAFAKFLRDDMTWARGWGGSRPAEASKGRGDIADGWRGWFQTSGPGPGKGRICASVEKLSRGVPEKGRICVSTEKCQNPGQYREKVESVRVSNNYPGEYRKRVESV